MLTPPPGKSALLELFVPPPQTRCCRCAYLCICLSVRSGVRRPRCRRDVAYPSAQCAGRMGSVSLRCAAPATGLRISHVVTSACCADHPALVRTGSPLFVVAARPGSLSLARLTRSWTARLTATWRWSLAITRRGGRLGGREELKQRAARVHGADLDSCGGRASPSVYRIHLQDGHVLSNTGGPAASPRDGHGHPGGAPCGPVTSTNPPSATCALADAISRRYLGRRFPHRAPRRRRHSVRG